MTFTRKNYVAWAIYFMTLLMLFGSWYLTSGFTDFKTNLTGKGYGAVALTPIIVAISFIAAWAQIKQPKKIHVDFDKEKIIVDKTVISFSEVVSFSAVKANRSKFYRLRLEAGTRVSWHSFLYVLAYKTNSNDDEIKSMLQQLKFVI